MKATHEGQRLNEVSVETFGDPASGLGPSQRGHHVHGGKIAFEAVSAGLEMHEQSPNILASAHHFSRHHRSFR